MKKFIIVKRIKDYEDADYHIVGTSDSKEEAEAQRDLWNRIKAQEEYSFYVFRFWNSNLEIEVDDNENG
jgi:hypothetical protein|tara:strand:- start:12041 stop:12247 length:207 start_codon:yes stop_codon:yes gene_type:complete